MDENEANLHEHVWPIKYRIYRLLEPPESEETPDLYDIVMMVTIIVSIFPMMFKGTYRPFEILDYACTALFIIDYALRWFTADLKLQKHGPVAYIAYPFTFMAIIDLLSILPGITVLNRSFRLFRVVRLIRMFRIFRVFKAFRYSRNIEIIMKIIDREKESLIAVCWISAVYIFISALIIYNVEPQSFENFFEAIYWATVSLTTVGYGDIYPVTPMGQIVTMISSVFGIAVIAMPAGIISAGFVNELHQDK
ncbi:voltage-gated potassium channel [Lachnospiraceae bacterium NK3A20]|nr:voltage-gated potassium channel [Lachnospiraceae bacterium NK3A20]